MSFCAGFFGTFFFVTIRATPSRIITITMIVVIVKFSCRIAHPNNTAMTGLTYAKVFANDADITRSNQ